MALEKALTAIESALKRTIRDILPGAAANASIVNTKSMFMEFPDEYALLAAFHGVSIDPIVTTWQRCPVSGPLRT